MFFVGCLSKCLVYFLVAIQLLQGEVRRSAEDKGCILKLQNDLFFLPMNEYRIFEKWANEYQILSEYFSLREYQKWSINILKYFKYSDLQESI